MEQAFPPYPMLQTLQPKSDDWRAVASFSGKHSLAGSKRRAQKRNSSKPRANPRQRDWSAQSRGTAAETAEKKPILTTQLGVNTPVSINSWKTNLRAFRQQSKTLEELEIKQGAKDAHLFETAS